MTVSSTTNRNSYIGNGAVDTYSYTFRIFDQDDLLVIVRDTDDVETTLSITTDYTVTGVGGLSGGTVVLVNSAQAWLDGDGDLKTDYVISIRRVRDLVQETDIRNQGTFFPETHEDTFDHLLMIDQQQQDEIDRSMKLSESTDPADFDTKLPADLVGASNRLLAVNAAGDGFALSSETTLGPSDPETYENKSLVDGSTHIIGSVDATKKVKFEVDGLTTATTRTLTVPDLSMTLLGADSVQSMSNKTFSDAVILSEIATPDTPSSGLMKVYPKSDNFLYSLDDTGAERKVGSGSGADTFYFEDFESGVYTAFTASGSFALANGARATTAVLDGGKEAKFTRGSSADTISWSVPIPVGYNPSIVRISFLYETGSSYVDDDIEIEVFNGATELGVVNHQLKAGKGKHICEFQTDAATADTTYTLKFKQATSGSWTDVYIDDLTVAAREIARGSVVTDPVAYTPTSNKATFSTLSGFWNREGKHMRVRIMAVASGGLTPADTNPITFSLPSGYTIDTSALPSSPSSYYQSVGTAQVIDYGVRGYIGIIYVNNTTTVGIRHTETTGSSTSDVEYDSPFTFGANDSIGIEFLVPIVGWSSNAVISSDFGSRIIAASAYRSGTQTGVNPNGSAVKININSKAASGAKGFDTTNSFDAVTNFRYDVLETGYYQVNGSINVLGTNVLNDTYHSMIKVSGSTSSYGAGVQPKVSSPFSVNVSSIIYLTTGQYVELFLYGAGNNSASTLTVSGGSDSTFLDIHKIQSPQTLMGSELVSACYTSSTGHNIVTGTVTFIDYETKVWDTHNAVLGAGSGKQTTYTSTFRYVAPYTGKYRVNAASLFASAAFNSTTALKMAIAINGTEHYAAAKNIEATYTDSQFLPTISTEVALTAGQALSVSVYHDQGSDRALQADPIYQRFTITKVG